MASFEDTFQFKSQLRRKYHRKALKYFELKRMKWICFEAVNQNFTYLVVKRVLFQFQ